MTERCVVFVQAESPRQVLRALDRLRRDSPEVPSSWWLTNPQLPHGFRALVTGPGAGDAEAQAAIRLSHILKTPTYLLRVWPESWEYTVWEQGVEAAKEAGTNTASRAWWQRLPGVPMPSEPWQTWGRERGLPVSCLADAPPDHTDVKNLVPYRTVAGLDQRGLLVERKNSWYVLTLGEVSS